MDIARLQLGTGTSRIRLLDRDGVFDWDDHGFDLVVVDTNTAALLDPDEPHRTFVVPAGEECKDFHVLERLMMEFARLELRRDSVIAAVGGGAVTDLAAFAASIYLRGIAIVLIPTSLLAMVDAALGGKTGIDLKGYKNMVGTFYPACEVRIVPEFLRSLSDREFRSGLAEVIKAALLGDLELLQLLEQKRARIVERDIATLREVIRRAVLVKDRFVSRDFTEQGVRAFLNLGHTFGHALEACLGLGRWTHGEAVAWGIARAMDAGLAAGLTDPAWAERVYRVLELYGYPVHERPVSAHRLIDAMGKDKKRRRDGIGFILQTGPCRTVQQVLDSSIIRGILDGDPPDRDQEAPR